MKEPKRDNKATYLLACMVFDGKVSHNAIKQLNNQEIITLEKYCAAALLRASDNIVKVPPKPHEIIDKVVKRKKEFKPFSFEGVPRSGSPRKPPHRATHPRVIPIKE